MFKLKSIGEFISEQKESSFIIDPEIEDIRYFRGNIEMFNNYIKKKYEIETNPHGTVHYKYPKERFEKDNSLPYQDFSNGTSSTVKYKKKRNAEYK